jgi:putative heme-binding domain-containing protein
VISYESDGLPAEYRGELLVPAWADHRVERYTLKPKGASFTAERKPFIQGGKDFYPSGLTVAPDGSLFVTDWGSKSYELHGKGAVWHIRWKDANPTKRATKGTAAIMSRDRRSQEQYLRTLAKDNRESLRRLATCPAPRIRAAVLTALIAADDEKIDLAKIAANDEREGIREMAVRALAARGKDTSAFADEKQPAAVRAAALAGRGEIPLLKLLADPDPFLRHAAILRTARTPDALRQIGISSVSDPKQRVGLLPAYRTGGLHKETAVLHFLSDADPDVRFLAIKWVADEKLTHFRPEIEAMLKSPKLDPREFVGLSTALARLDDKPVNDDNLAAYFLDRLADRTAPASVRLMALRSIPANHNRLKLDQLTELLKQDDPAFRIEALRALKDRADPKAAPAVLAIAKDEKQPTAVRAQALVTLSAMNAADVDLLIAFVGSENAALRQEALRALIGANLTPAQQEKLVAAAKRGDDAAEAVARVFGKKPNTNRPAATDVAAWLKQEGTPANPEAGRRIFEHPKLAAGCYKCHQVEGRGANIGPDLSLIGRTERKWILESILQPSAVVAPHFQAWKIQTTDDRTHTGLLVGTHLDESVYIDEKGNRFKVLATDVQDIRASSVSIMPEGLLDGLTDQEVRDLLAYLQSRK